MAAGTIIMRGSNPPISNFSNCPVPIPSSAKAVNSEAVEITM